MAEKTVTGEDSKPAPACVRRTGLALCCMIKASRHHEFSRREPPKGTVIKCDRCGTEIENIGGGWKAAGD